MAHFSTGFIPKIRTPMRPRNARYTSDLDRLVVTEGTCLAILNDVVIPSLSTTPPAFEGTGVVTCAGGKYLKLAYASISKLREVNATIPVQIWHIGPDEVYGETHKFKDLNVEFHDCVPFFDLENYRHRTGWSAKSVAVKNSPFRHVLFLDADSYPLLDPNDIFAHSDYANGMTVFPDGKKCRDTNAIFNALGIKYSDEFWEWEAGQFLVDKVEHWRAVQLYAWLNSHGYLFHRILWGDKDLMPLAALKLGEEFTTAQRPDWIDSGFIHKLTDGTPAFHHCLSPKRDPVPAPDDLQRYYDEYDKQETP